MTTCFDIDKYWLISVLGIRSWAISINIRSWAISISRGRQLVCNRTKQPLCIQNHKEAHKHHKTRSERRLEPPTSNTQVPKLKVGWGLAGGRGIDCTRLAKREGKFFCLFQAREEAFPFVSCCFYLMQIDRRKEGMK